ncbi:MAG: lipopolysaccharide biosynthesis protein [Paludibacteraceae bacterium]|nr:lipopolysaccharide biosynthesis protein [Paludibacteraceae bacterium]MBR5971067.1 lipopolysaccharide biosynthesis protein [Paludibacteraceae bacterium]
MSDVSLKQQAVNGVAWATVRKLVQVSISFISGIILARLLMPEDYGCIGMLAIFMQVSGAFVDGGFGSALIQKKQPTKEDYSTVFFWNLSISGIIYIILFFASPLIADFYHIPLLSKVLRVQGIVIILNALLFVQSNQLCKKFKFKKLAIVNSSTSVISLLVTIYMAYNGFGVWSLVTQNLLMSAIPMLCYWLTNRWYPSLSFSKKSFRELFSFGLYALLTSLLSKISNNIQGLLLGHFYNPTLMGYYSKAHSTERLASQTISDVFSQVTFPLYSELQDDCERMKNAIKKITGLLAFFVFPLMFVLILVAKPVFILLYSDRWLESIPYFQVLCLTGLAACLQAVNSQTIAAMGMGKVMFQWAVIKQSIGILAVIIGLVTYGIYGLLLAIVARAWFVYFVNAYLVSKYVGYKMKTQLFDLLPILLISAISLLVTYFAFSPFSLSMYVDGFFKLIFFGTIYLIGIKLFKPGVLNLAMSLLIPFVKEKFRMAKKKDE